MVLKKKQEIDANHILRFYSETIYRNELGDFTIGRAFCNCLRKDRKPSLTIFRAEDGNLLHKDFADDDYKGNCINLVAKKYSLTYSEAIKKIAQDLNLTDTTKLYIPVESQNKPITEPKKHCLIQVTARRYKKADLDYWLQYGIELEQLKREDIYCVEEFYINRIKQFIDKGELCFCYKYPEEKFKIYFPNREKNEKWKCNISLQITEKLEVLEKEGNIVLVKSKKDRMVLENLFPELLIVNVQNESISAFTDVLLKKLEGRKVWLSYDSDTAGKKASLAINKKFPWMKHINTPDRCLPLKDWSDLMAKYGEDIIIKHFKQKGLC